jgi:hypothetical protein
MMADAYSPEAVGKLHVREIAARTLEAIARARRAAACPAAPPEANAYNTAAADEAERLAKRLRGME